MSVTTKSGRTFQLPTEEEDQRITQAANADPDARPFTTEELANIKPSLGRINIAALLETDDDIRDFLQEAMEEGNPDEIIRALNIAARAKGMAEQANPRFDTVMSLIQALELRLSVHSTTS